MLNLKDVIKVEIEWNTGDEYWDNEPICEALEDTVENIVDYLEMSEEEKLYLLEENENFYDDEMETWHIVSVKKL